MVRFWIALCVVLIAVCGRSVADCANVSGVTGWRYIDSHTIVVYRGTQPIALLKIPWCFIFTTSQIRFLKTFICPWDKILIDGNVCDITDIYNL
jgi:hypothetical protein